LFAREVGLEPHDLTRALAPARPGRLDENGAAVMVEIRRAGAGRDYGRLRKLCSWFPFGLRMSEVHELLDGLPRPKAEQIAGLRVGLGSPTRPPEQVGIIATLDLLQKVRGLSIAEASRRLARFVHITPERVRTLHADFRKLVRALEGYRIPASDVSRKPWGQNDHDELSVYVKQPADKLGPHGPNGKEP
jgi:hypothetical protein